MPRLGKSNKYKTLAWSYAIPVGEMKGLIRRLGRDGLINPLVFDEYFPPLQLPAIAQRKPGFITRARDRKANICEQHPEPPTITSIVTRIEEAGTRVEVEVTATHPAGIKEISIYLGSYVMVPSGSGRGLKRQPRIRRRDDRSQFGDTWTRGDSTDATPQAALSLFPRDEFEEFNNCIIAKAVSTCDTEVYAHTDPFDRP